MKADYKLRRAVEDFLENWRLALASEHEPEWPTIIDWLKPLRDALAEAQGPGVDTLDEPAYSP